MLIVSFVVCIPVAMLNFSTVLNTLPFSSSRRPPTIIIYLDRPLEFLHLSLERHCCLYCLWTQVGPKLSSRLKTDFLPQLQTFLGWLWWQLELNLQYLQLTPLLFDFGHFLFKNRSEIIENTPKAFKNTLRALALIFEAFFKSWKSDEHHAPKS